MAISDNKYVVAFGQIYLCVIKSITYLFKLLYSIKYDFKKSNKNQIL